VVVQITTAFLIILSLCLLRIIGNTIIIARFRSEMSRTQIFSEVLDIIVTFIMGWSATEMMKALAQ
jgi:hypothetical protein